jgi:hypothetical protein
MRGLDGIKYMKKIWLLKFIPLIIPWKEEWLVNSKMASTIPHIMKGKFTI